MIATIGAKAIGQFNYLTDLAALFWKSLIGLFFRHHSSRRLIWRTTVRQVLFTGVDGLPVISMVSALLGMVIIIQTYTLLPALGSGKIVSSLLVLIIVRELGPIVTAFIIIGRSGTALSTEIGNMMVSHEVDALRAMGIDPIRYLVTPRLLGMVISMLMLGIYFNVIGILGGFLVAQLQVSLTLDAFGQNLLQALQVEDLYISLVKNSVFGICIALICCYQGLQVKLSSTEVPQKTTKAVVSSIFFCFFFNAFFTVLFYI